MTTQEQLPEERRWRRVSKRKPRRVKHLTEPYATIRCRDVLSVACGRCPAAMRVLLLGHAAWLPDSDPDKPGKAILPRKKIRNPLPKMVKERRAPAPGNLAIAQGFEELAEWRMVLCVKEATQPNRAGGGRGEAGEYGVPARDGSYESPPPLPHGLRSHNTLLRLRAAMIRADVTELTDLELVVLVYAWAIRPRDRHGAVAEPRAALDLSPSLLCERLKIPRATLARVFGGLVAKKRFTIVRKGRGASPTVYELADRYLRGLARR